MPQRIDLAELRAARKMEPKILVLDGREHELPADIPMDGVLAVMDGEFQRAAQRFFGDDWRAFLADFGLTLGDLLDVVKLYLPDLQRLGESLASANSSNGAGRH